MLQLKETNETLKKYLEALMRGVGKQETSRLIESEERRLSEIRQIEQLGGNRLVGYVASMLGGRKPGDPVNSVVKALREASGYEEFARIIGANASDPLVENTILGTLRSVSDARSELNKARQILNLPPFKKPRQWSSSAEVDPGAGASRNKDLARPHVDGRSRSDHEANGPNKPLQGKPKKTRDVKSQEAAGLPE